MTKPEILAEIQRLKTAHKDQPWEWRPKVKKLIAALEVLEDPFADHEFFGKDAPDWQDKIQEDRIERQENHELTPKDERNTDSN